MRNKKYIPFVVMMLLAVSCQHQPKNALNLEGAEEIIVDARPEKANVLSLDSIFDKVDYIKLETQDDNLIGRIDQIIVTDSLIIVSDTYSANAVFVFDLQGRFKCKVGHRGNGPGEYVEVSHIAIEPETKQIIIQDRPQKRILHYNYQGKHLWTIQPLPFHFSTFEFIDANHKAFNVTAMYDDKFGQYKGQSLIVTDSAYNILYGACPDIYKADVFEQIKIESLWRFGDSVYYSPNFSHIIYTVTDSMVRPKYHINIIWNGMPPFDENITGKLFDEYASRYFFFNGNFIELQDFSFINIMMPGANPFLVYVHKTKKSYFTTGRGTHPLFPMLARAPISRYKENTVVYYLETSTIMAYKENHYKDYASYKTYLNSFYNDLTEESNHVLFFCHLNENLGNEKLY